MELATALFIDAGSLARTAALALGRRFSLTWWLPTGGSISRGKARGGCVNILLGRYQNSNKTLACQSIVFSTTRQRDKRSHRRAGNKNPERCSPNDRKRCRIRDRSQTRDTSRNDRDAGPPPPASNRPRIGPDARSAVGGQSPGLAGVGPVVVWPLRRTLTPFWGIDDPFSISSMGRNKGFTGRTPLDHRDLTRTLRVALWGHFGNKMGTVLAISAQCDGNIREQVSIVTRVKTKTLSIAATCFQYHEYGRRTGLKIRWGNTRVGSSPTFGI